MAISGLLSGSDPRLMARLSGNFTASDAFREPPSFSHQYTSYYYTRLCQLRPHIAIPPEWRETARPVERILDVHANELCWICGTVTREAAAKPNIVQDLKKMYHGEMPEHPIKYTTPNDKLFIEDEHGRIEFLSKSSDFLVTGMVVALLGSQNPLGEFEVVEVAYPEMPTQAARQSSRGKIAFVSGISLTDSASEPFNVQLLLEYLAVHPEILCLVICGNSLSSPPLHLSGARLMKPAAGVHNLEQLDRLLTSLAMFLPVHVMPGESDPVTIAFPQTALHPAILEKSRHFLESRALTLETNPQRFDFGGTVITGSSGQPVADLKRYLTEADESRMRGKPIDLELLWKTLQWRHMAPTAPDTLSSYPYAEYDPLVLNERPHVYFTGNSPEFSTEVRENVRLLCVPKFSECGEIVLLDAENLEPEVVKFDLGN